MPHREPKAWPVRQVGCRIQQRKYRIVDDRLFTYWSLSGPFVPANRNDHPAVFLLVMQATEDRLEPLNQHLHP
jgi:hypothetical protein